MTEIHRCPICDANSFVPFLNCIDHSISNESFQLIRCTQCDLIITSPRPSTQELGKYYASPKYTSHLATAKTILDRIYFLARNFTLKWKLSLIEEHTTTSVQTLLDFGCGTAELLKAASARGWTIAGVEPSQSARQQSDPTVTNYVKSSLNEIPKDGVRFSAITLWHVLEHIEDLNETLRSLKELLHQDGTIFIAVPNPASWDARHYQQAWAAYDVPRHLWHFKPNTLQHLMQKHHLTVHTIIPMRLDAFYVALLSEKYQNHQSLSFTQMIEAFVNAVRSNHHASKTMDYSSLIYVVKK